MDDFSIFKPIVIQIDERGELLRKSQLDRVPSEGDDRFDRAEFVAEHEGPVEAEGDPATFGKRL